MSLASYRIALLGGAFLLAAATGLMAQERHDGHDHPAGVACGTTAMSSYDRAATLENTRRANPALFERITSGKRDRGARLMDEYLIFTFLVRNRVTNELEEIQGALVYDGLFSRVWVDCRDTGKSTHKPTSSKMRKLFKALDTAIVDNDAGLTPRNANQGILQNDIEVFGQIPQTYQLENKTDFLLLDIKDEIEGQNVLGYFSPSDQTEGAESNRMNLLYIDSKEGFAGTRMTKLLAIIAHEFQHLIHYGRHNTLGGDPVARDVVFNEGMSEVASILNGYHFRSNAGYLQNTNIDLFEWHYSDGTLQENDYQRAMTFMHYLSEQFGEGFLYEFVGSPEKNMDRLNDALRRNGRPDGFDHREVLKGYAVANALRSHTNPAYSYRDRLSSSIAKPQESFSGTAFEPSMTRAVEGYGTYYMQFNNPGGLRVRFSGSQDIRVMMIGIRPGDTVIQEMQLDTEYSLPNTGEVFPRIIFAIVNTGAGVREATVAASGFVSGVEHADGTTGRLAIAMVSDDGDGSASVAYALPASGPVRLELFSMRGELVRTIVDEPRDAGSHHAVVDLGGLASGSYMVRLVQNGAVASHVLHVTR